MADDPTVFVVDDDPAALQSLCWLIRQAGLLVRAFRSGREFLEACQRREVGPGCLVLDVRMPEMDGLEVQRRLAELRSDLPIIFITAFGDAPTCHKALKAGAVEFLEKPVDCAILLDCLQRALAHGAEQKPPGELAAQLGELPPSEGKHSAS
jgi:two-component system response regulator FixJ